MKELKDIELITEDKNKTGYTLSDDFIVRKKSSSSVSAFTVAPSAPTVEKTAEQNAVEKAELKTSAAEVRDIPETTVAQFDPSYNDKSKLSLSGMGSIINNSAVLDDALISEDKRKKKKKERVNHNIVEKTKRGSIIGSVVFLSAIFVVLLLIIDQNVRINEYTGEIAETKARIEELQKESKIYESKISSGINMIDIGNRSSSEFGMVVEEDEADKKYISLSESDSISSYEAGDDFSDSLTSTVMSVFGKNIVSAWNSLFGGE